MKKINLTLFFICYALWSFGQISTFPYSYGFENESGTGTVNCGTPYTMLEAGWLNETASDDIDWSADNNGTSSNPGGPSADHTTGSGYYMYIEATGACNPANTADLYTPNFDFSSLNIATMSFWYHLYGSNMGDLSVDYELSVAPGTWSSLPITSNSPAGGAANSITDNVNAWQLATIDLDAAGLSNLVGATVRFRFRGTTGNGFLSDMAIDDILIFSNACPVPTGLTLSNITSTTVEASWTSGATSFQVEAVPSGASPTGLGALTSSNPFTITGLNPTTNYDVYVRAVCGADTSIWLGPETFTTACAIYIAPYLESFDSVNFTPNCWTDDIPASNTEDWRYSVTGPFYGANGVQDHTGNGGVFAWIDGSTANNPTGTPELLISPIVDISGLTNPTLRFYAFSNNTDFPGDNNTLTVNVIDIGNSGAVTNILTNQADLGPNWFEFMFDLSSFVGPIQVEFGVDMTTVNDPFYNDILLDDIEFYDGPSCFSPSGLTGNSITDSSVVLEWITGATQSIVEVVPMGSTPTGVGMVVNDTTETITGLMNNTTYDVYVAALCTPSDTSAFAGPYTFTTACGMIVGDSATNPIIVNDTSYTFIGSTATCFTGQVGETSPDVWFMVVLDHCATELNASLCNSDFDTYLHILDTGLNSIATNDDGCGAQSRLSNVPITGGDTVYVVVEGFGSNVGNFELNLTQAISVVTGTDVQVACGSYTWINGMTYTSSNNTAMDTIVGGSVNGCDSIVTLDLTILPLAMGTDVQVACGSYTWTNGMTYTSSNNTAMDTIVGGSANGCDSVVTLDLTILPLAMGTDVQVACGSYTWINGMTYTSSNNTAMDTIVGGSANGCDSIVTLDLTINTATMGTDVQVACGSYTWINGMTYTSSNNTAMDTIVGGSVNGCDSIVTLDLLINTATMGTDVQVACGSYTWINGMTYTSSNNTAMDTIVGGSANGCDSIVTLDLTINTVDTSVSQAGFTLSSNAMGATYQWIDCNNGNTAIPSETNQSFTAIANGDYAVVVTENGCIDTSACINITGVSVINTAFDTEVKAYPNPTDGNLFIDLGVEYESLNVTVRNTLGQMLENQNYKAVRQMELALEYVSGVYFIELRTDDNKIAVLRIVKE